MRNPVLTLCVVTLLMSADAGASQPRTDSLAGVRVLVDAGHGGHDTGAVSPRGILEKQVALDIARRLARELKDRGAEVRMTRDEDHFVTLDDRARMAAEMKADLFVSVHANASPSPDLRGFEIYRLSDTAGLEEVALRRAAKPTEQLERPERFAEPGESVKAVYWDLVATENRRRAAETASAMKAPLERDGLAPVCRLRTADFRVLKWSESPALLLETGYLTNRDDERKLRSPIYRGRLARTVADLLAGHLSCTENL